ncbi:hypothetical protein [Kineosporia mesophila]|nr:hypothetical protein [Kineosporia mesophila]MCD5353740.1 hypothetical protein [Kineosporia mesophila]
MMLDAWEVDPDGSIELPPVLAGGAGIEVAHRLQDVLGPTQHQTSSTYGRPMASAGEL